MYRRVALSEFDKAMTVAKLKGAAGRLRLRSAERSPLLGVSRIDERANGINDF